MARREKKPVHKVVMTEGKRNIIQQLLQEYDIETAEDIQDTALLKALYLATFEATKKWTMPLRNWGQVYGELSIMYEGRI